MSYVIAVDGASGTGKGTVTRYVAEQLNLDTIDTGALYRCITLEALNNEVALDDKQALENIAKTMDVELKVVDGVQKVFLNGEDVSVEIRTPRVTNHVAIVSAIREVRAQMVQIQRRLAQGKNIIMEGRDIGTTVFPDADVKIFLECSAEERAKRRVAQNAESGIETSYEEVLESIKQRDLADSTREVSPLRKAKDAIVVSTDGCDPKDGGRLVYEAVEKALKEKGLI